MKIKKSSLLILAITTTIVSCTSKKLGYVNPQRLIGAYHGTAPVKQQLQARIDLLQANIDSLTAEAAEGPAAGRAGKQQVLLRYQEQAQRKALAEEQALNETLLQDINGYIKQYGKEKGYHFIFAATEQGNIVYAADGTDLTEDVLAGLNARYDQQHAGVR